MMVKCSHQYYVRDKTGGIETYRGPTAINTYRPGRSCQKP